MPSPFSSLLRAHYGVGIIALSSSKRPRDYEIVQLVRAASRLRESYPFRLQVYGTLLGLIAATGLRISEALDLRLSDVLPDGVLQIRRTKFGKSRLVPLHPTAANAVDRYLEGRGRLAVTDDHVFLSAGNRRISSSTVEYTFRRIRQLVGIAPARTRPPRIHDLRHTFATRALEQCPTRREAVASLRCPGDVPGPLGYRSYLLVPGGNAGSDDRHRRRSRSAGRWGGHMTPIAPLITSFLREHMPIEHGRSPHTCETYAHAFCRPALSVLSQAPVRATGLQLFPSSPRPRPSSRQQTRSRLPQGRPRYPRERRSSRRRLILLLQILNCSGLRSSR
jgi:Phage integrase family